MLSSNTSTNSMQQLWAEFGLRLRLSLTHLKSWSRRVTNADFVGYKLTRQDDTSGSAFLCYKHMLFRAHMSMVSFMKVLDPILWSTLHFSTPLRPNHRRHTFTTAATVCLGCGLSLNITCETYNLHWTLRVTCTIEMFVTPSSTHVVLFIH